MAHTFWDIYNWFEIFYGPWGRPDMALFLFTKAALEGNKIDVFNNGEMLRDFTYIDDIVEGVIRVIDNPAKSDKNWNGKTGETSSSSAPYNIGNNNPVKLITAIENKQEMFLQLMLMLVIQLKIWGINKFVDWI